MIQNVNDLLSLIVLIALVFSSLRILAHFFFPNADKSNIIHVLFSMKKYDENEEE